VANLDAAIAAAPSDNQPPGVTDGFRKQRDAIQPYIGKQLLRTGMWLSGRRHEMYIDPVSEVVVYLWWSNAPDPDTRPIRIIDEHVPLLQRVLVADADPEIRQIGEHGEILYLVEHDVTQNELEILDQLIAFASSGKHAPSVAQARQSHRDALRPYVGMKLLKAGMACAARQHEIYIDPARSTIVDFIWGALSCNQAANFDPSDPSTWLNMHHDWYRTIEDDVVFREWLESTLFPSPNEFFDDASFEASRTLYEVKLQDSLLEHAVYQGIEPAVFQKDELNAAIRDVSLELFGHCEAKWIHVNVHDNVARSVEMFGRYSFDYPLAPVYVLLIHHQAEEGGTTYAGVASANREWVLLFEDGLHISVHGPKSFVDRVCESLRLNQDA
jgi:hypothetical protein